MNREFISEKDTIKEALDDIDSFVTKMSLFQKDHPEYAYDIDLKRNTKIRSEYKWVVYLKVTKDEKQENIRVS